MTSIHFVYILLVLALLSLIIPAWEVSRRSYPSFKSRGMAHPFQMWFLGGLFWFGLSYFVNIFVILMCVLGGTHPCMAFLEQLHYSALFLAWPVHAAVGGIAWITQSKKLSSVRWQYLFFLFNISCIIFILLSGNPAASVLLGGTIFVLWIWCMYVSAKQFTSTKDIIALFLLVGSGLGGIGGFLWLIGKFYSPGLNALGIHLWMSAGIIVIAAGLIIAVLKRITGMNIYYRALNYLTLVVLCVWGPYTFLNMDGDPSALGTVVGVGAGFAGLFLGTNIWMAFKALKEKNIDELSARWASLGSWLPTGVTAQFVSFGGWCIFIGSILLFISSFQNMSAVLMPTLWREGLIKLLIVGGAGSFYIAAAYCAWAEKASTPDNYIAEVGYWHFFGGSIVMWICYLVSGIVLASQNVFAAALKKICMPGEAAVLGKCITDTIEQVSSIGQRPFLIGIAAAHIMVFASVLILGINLYRARNKAKNN